jgi:opacity protein-like surface antigen
MIFRVCQLALVCALFGGGPSAWAQDYDPFEESYDYMPTRGGGVLRNQIDLELVDLVSSSLALRYEHSLNRYLSLAIHPQWWWGYDDGTGFDFGLTLQLRWYPEGHAMNGWYLSPQLGFFQVTGIDYLGYSQIDRSYLYSLVIGYNWIIAHAFSMYFGGGVAYTHGSNNLSQNNYYPLYVLGPFPVFEFGIGVPF